MQVKQMACAACDCLVQGHFDTPRLALLPREQAEFLAEYVLAGCSLKDLGTRMGLSYPAVRARLDRVIEALRAIDAARRPRAELQDILDRIERGELRADDAARLIEGEHDGD
jgi:hypothetical protein